MLGSFKQHPFIVSHILEARSLESSFPKWPLVLWELWWRICSISFLKLWCLAAILGPPWLCGCIAPTFLHFCITFSLSAFLPFLEGPQSCCGKDHPTLGWLLKDLVFKWSHIHRNQGSGHQHISFLRGEVEFSSQPLGAQEVRTMNNFSCQQFHAHLGEVTRLAKKAGTANILIFKESLFSLKQSPLQTVFPLEFSKDKSQRADYMGCFEGHVIILIFYCYHLEIL